MPNEEETLFETFVSGLDRQSLDRLLRVLDSWTEQPGDEPETSTLHAIVDAAYDYTSTVLDEMRNRHV